MAQSIPNDDATLRLAIADTLREIKSIRSEMAKDQVEIERLKLETAELKAKTDVLKGKTRAIIASLKAAWDA